MKDKEARNKLLAAIKEDPYSLLAKLEYQLTHQGYILVHH